MKLEEMRSVLEAYLPRKRFKHSVAVYETALDLAEVHGLSPALTEKVAVASLLHDCGREVPVGESLAHAKELGIDVTAVEKAQPVLLHAKLGVYYARTKYGVEDEEILSAIAEHTTGGANMSVLSKIVFLADMLEPDRSFSGVEELRRLARRDLEAAMLRSYSNNIKYLLEKKLIIHPDCIEGYNELLLKSGKV